jgi:parallel beta-helix repeat protein
MGTETCRSYSFRIFLLSLLFLLPFSITLATDYYVSSSGNDSNDGLSTSSPWRTITRVNSYFPSLRAGDRILFRRGDTFYGTIKILKSGSSGSPITIGAYGSGNKPIITGFTTVSDWTNEGNGIYSKVISAEAQTNIIRVNGTQYAMGRWPDDGYNIYESYSSNTSITDNELSASIDWTGAEAAIRKNDWSLDRCRITDHTGTRLTYTSLGSTDRPMANNYGYFIQNDLRCLTRFGEWYHNNSTGKFYLYFGSTDPSTRTVEVATLNNLIHNNGYDYITVDDIELRGSISHIAVYLNYSSDNCVFRNVTVSYGGQDGIHLLGNNCTIENNQISYCNQAGIFAVGSGNITSNYIFNIGLIAGQAYYGTFINAIKVTNNNMLFSITGLTTAATVASILLRPVTSLQSRTIISPMSAWYSRMEVESTPLVKVLQGLLMAILL